MVVALLGLALSTNGCTLLGAGVGAAVDGAVPGPYDTRRPSAHLSFKPKDRIMVWRENGERIEGRYLGALGPNPRDPETYLIVDTGSRAVTLPVSDVHALGVEVSGKGWVYGGLIGLAMDAAFVVAVAIAMHDMKMDGLKLGGGSGCFC
ncbi:MAG: hypothetical protein QM756_35980 [Polyangiaceae bacterium]